MKMGGDIELGFYTYKKSQGSQTIANFVNIRSEFYTYKKSQGSQTLWEGTDYPN